MAAMHTICATYNSLEEWCLATDAMGWETDFRQLDLGRGSSQLRAVATDNAVLMRVDFSNRMHQRAVPVKDCQTFGILARPQAPGKIGSRVLESESLLLMDPGCGLDAVIEPGFAAYTFSVNDNRLRQLAELQELPDPTAAIARPGSERALDPLQLASIRSSLADILLQADAGATVQATQAMMESELPAVVLRNWFGAAGRLSPRTSNRARVLRRALEFLDAYPREPLTVEQLCLASASSFSTLERAFKDHFGVSPKRYLMLSRFSGVRRSLLGRENTRSITDVANEWGFWHMGKFAADYKRFFGQLPSKARLY
jgi:AraC family ethanolamine operon transcriptional activator